ncbi:MAG: ABC transporter permease [Acidimicrobiales bacterium]
MWKVALKGTWAHKRRLIGTGSAVVLGIAFLVGTLVLSDTMRGGFDDLITDANAGIDAVIQSETTIGSEMATQQGLLDGSLVDEARALDGVAAAEPSIEALGQIVDAHGEVLGGQGPPTIAGNWIENADLNSLRVADGRAPESRGEVVIDTQAAEDGDLSVGDETSILTPQPVDVEIVGLVESASGSSTGGVTFVLFTFEDAQRYLMGDTDKVTRVVVQAERGVSEATLVDRLEPIVPPGAEAITGEAFTDQTLDEIGQDFLDFFEIFLLVFAGIALLVASFSIYNTFSITIAQRMRESALLRAIGSSRRQILGSVVLESLIVGIVASAVGLVAGVFLALGLKALLGLIGFDVPTSLAVVSGSTIMLAFVVGIGVTVLASGVPAFRASRVPPLAALRDVSIDRSDISITRAVIGALFAAVGTSLVVISALVGGDGVLTRAGAGAALTLIGIVILGPVVARPMSAILGRPVDRLRGVTGSLARQNAMRNPRRTAGTASALMIGVAVVTLFTVFAASLKASIDESVREQFGGDLVITSGFSGAGLSPELATDINQLDEVDTAASMGFGAALVDGEERGLSIADPEQLTRVFDLEVASGSIDDIGAEGFAASQDLAEESGWEVGESVPFEFADGTTEEIPLAAIFESDALAGILVPRDVWAPHAAQQIDFQVLIRLADGVSVADGKAAVEEVASEFGVTDVQDRDEFIGSIAGQVNIMLGVVYVLLALAIVIALMGIANTLSLSVHERTRELGLLRAVGQTRPQVRSMIRWESVIVALFGTVGGLGLGTFLGWALMRAAAEDEGIGVFVAPVFQLVLVLALGALVGIVAAVRPARRAARLDVLQAIATE